jgi:hypothetical protein
METTKSEIVRGLAVVSAAILFVALLTASSASAATSFTGPSPFKQGGTGNTQIIPVYPSWSVNIPLSPPQNFAAASSTVGGSLSTGANLFFKVASLNATGTSAPSTELSTTTAATNSQVNLTWIPVPGATGYAVYYSTTTAGLENAFQIATATNAYDFTSTSSPAYATPLGFPTAFAVQLSNATSSLNI